MRYSKNAIFVKISLLGLLFYAFFLYGDENEIIALNRRDVFSTAFSLTAKDEQKHSVLLVVKNVNYLPNGKKNTNLVNISEAIRNEQLDFKEFCDAYMDSVATLKIFGPPGNILTLRMDKKYFERKVILRPRKIKLTRFAFKPNDDFRFCFDGSVFAVKFGK